MRFTQVTLTAVLIAAGWSPSAVTAQETGTLPQPLVGGQHGGYHHASTVAEGALRGEADLIRSQGEYNYNTALAHLIGQEARSKALENEIKQTQTYFAKRDLNRSYRAAERAPRASQDDLNRYSQQRTPARLARHQFDAASGQIYWPATLGEEEFAASREQLEALFKFRTHRDSGLGTENYRQVQDATREMRAALQSRIGMLEPAEYMVAKKFLDGLAYEARFPAELDAVAAN